MNLKKLSLQKKELKLIKSFNLDLNTKKFDIGQTFLYLLLVLSYCL